MAMWQEQEDGVVKNFSIIVLAKDWSKSELIG
jgi:hypothetical protein